jgi:hypothetical protein
MIKFILYFKSQKIQIIINSFTVAELELNFIILYIYSFIKKNIYYNKLAH